MAGELVPFGKYRGQPVETLAADPEYTDWLAAQPWFRERHPNVYAVIVNHFKPPEDTPEHNALQARFLNEDFCLATAIVLGLDVVLANGARSILTEELDIKTSAHFEVQGWDVLLELEVTNLTSKAGRSHTLCVELKPTLGDDYPAVLRQMKGNYPRRVANTAALMIGNFTAKGATFEQVCTIFRNEDIKVVLWSEVEELLHSEGLSHVTIAQGGW
jgi:hypothetical protein